jgi:23S rRNA (cytosine1962-C5)-methyltransferase
MSSSKRSPRSGGPKGRDRGDKSGPTVRESGVKVKAPAASALRAGHPWVFKDALLRPLAVDTGSVINIADEDGQRIGWGVADAQATVAVRMLGRGERESFGPEQVAARVRAAVERRTRLMGEECSASRRLVHGEGDGLPGLSVDRLGDYLVVYRYAKVVDGFLESALDALEACVEPAGIYLQDRVRSVSADDRRPGAKLVRGKIAPAEYEVDEDGLKFLVDPSAPVSPGLFLDLREGRRVAEKWAKDRRFLNLFSFTGAFGLRAVRGGASEVTNVDAAARSHARCRQNLAASGLDSEAVDGIVGDCFKHLARFRQRGRKFDFVVVDPPPFSNVDGSVFSAMRNWTELVQAIAEVMEPGGVMMAVCNAAGLDEGDFAATIGRGANRARTQARLIGELGLPPDFPVPPAFGEGRYLKVKLVEIG